MSKEEQGELSSGANSNVATSENITKPKTKTLQSTGTGSDILEDAQLLKYNEFPAVVLEKILSYVPTAEGCAEGQQYKKLLPLRAVNSSFAVITPPVALASVVIKVRNPERLKFILKSLGETPTGFHSSFVNCVKELTFNDLITPPTFGDDIRPVVPASIFSHLLNSAARLQKFNMLSGWASLAKSDVSAFNSPQLTHLTILHSRRIPDSFYAPFSRADVFPKLKHLKVEEIIDGGPFEPKYLHGILPAVGRLTSLSICDRHVTGTYFASNVVPHLQGLTKLELPISAGQWYPELSAAIAEHCDSLQKLTIQRLNDTCMRLLCAGDADGRKCFLRSLQNLVVCESSITAASIPHLQRFPNLKSLVLQECYAFEEEEFVNFERELPGVVTVQYYIDRSVGLRHGMVS